MNLLGSFTRVGHRAVKFQIRTEGSLMPTIGPEGVCIILQIIVLIIAGSYVSGVQLSIPPVFVQVILKRNREHHSKCFLDAWNVIGYDSDNSRCHWSDVLRGCQHWKNPVTLNARAAPKSPKKGTKIVIRHEETLAEFLISIPFQNI